jgi:ubiquinone/menaquinone biosynthesis C-methylase UbiE
MTSQKYWQNIYDEKSGDEVSWYQNIPQQSLAYIDLAKLDSNDHIFDIGGGESRLVDELIEGGYRQLSVLDLCECALKAAKKRLRNKPNHVNWYVANILSHPFKSASVDLWHDRAVFHFLVTNEEQETYLKQLNGALKDGGFIVLSTFDLGGPMKCSGLPIKQYSWQSLSKRLGKGFTLVSHCQHNHITPFATHQLFNYCIFRRTINDYYTE